MAILEKLFSDVQRGVSHWDTRFERKKLVRCIDVIRGLSPLGAEIAAALDSAEFKFYDDATFDRMYGVVTRAAVSPQVQGTFLKNVVLEYKIDSIVVRIRKKDIKQPNNLLVLLDNLVHEGTHVRQMRSTPELFRPDSLNGFQNVISTEKEAFRNGFELTLRFCLARADNNPSAILNLPNRIEVQRWTQIRTVARKSLDLFMTCYAGTSDSEKSLQVAMGLTDIVFDFYYTGMYRQQYLKNRKRQTTQIKDSGRKPILSAPAMVRPVPAFSQKMDWQGRPITISVGKGCAPT